MKIICPELDCHQALVELNIKLLAHRRDTHCIQLIKDMSNPEHKLQHLLPNKVSQVNDCDTRSNGDKYYNFACKTERYKHSALFYAIDKYNSSLEPRGAFALINVFSNVHRLLIQWNKVFLHSCNIDH